jgi:hypothetical protein
MMLKTTDADDFKQKALRQLVESKILSSGSQNIKSLIDDNDEDTLAEIHQFMLQKEVEHDEKYIQNVKDEMRSIEDVFRRDRETFVHVR